MSPACAIGLKPITAKLAVVRISMVERVFFTALPALTGVNLWRLPAAR
jgi:hypothetical protein